MLYLVNKNTTHFNQFKEYIPLCQKKNISHNNDNDYKQINSTSYQKKKKKPKFYFKITLIKILIAYKLKVLIFPSKFRSTQSKKR